MEALRASYGETSSDSETDSDPTHLPEPNQSSSTLPPPPLSLLHPPNSPGAFDYSSEINQPTRVRSFPHVEGNFSLHVYIPVSIPLVPRKELAQFLRRVTTMVPGLHVVDIDIPLNNLVDDVQKLEQVVLGREFHVSLGRTIPIRVHQRDSVVSMLRQRLHSQRRYWIDFNKWEVFVNDDRTRTFLSMEVTAGGLAEIADVEESKKCAVHKLSNKYKITKQIQAVNEVYRLHNLPEFYKDPRPHISVAWALGDISDSLKRVMEEDTKRYITNGALSQKHTFMCKFSGISCKIGNKTFEICKIQEDKI